MYNNTLIYIQPDIIHPPLIFDTEDPRYYVNSATVLFDR